MAKKWKGLTAGAMVMALSSQGWAATTGVQTPAAAPIASPSGTQAPATAVGAKPNVAPPPGAHKWDKSGRIAPGEIPALPNGGKPDPKLLSQMRTVVNDRLAQLTQHKQDQLTTKHGGGEPNNTAPQEQLRPDSVVRVIVQLSQPSAAKQAAAAGARLSAATSATMSQWQGSAVKQQAAAKAAIQSAGLNVTYRHSYTTALNGFAAEIKYGDLAKLNAIPGVTRVTVARKYTLNDAASNELIGAVAAWEGTPGFNGADKVIAIVDTGIDWRHPDLGGATGAAAKVIGGYNFADHSDDYINRQGSQHGTHVAGIAAASASPNSREHVNGVAPGAKLLAQKVFSNDVSTPSAYTDDLVAAIDDAVDIHSPHHDGVVANVINMSLGSTAGFTDAEDPEQVAVADATAAGTVVTISAGNSYYNTQPYGLPYFRNQDIAAIGSPGTSAQSIAVASSQNAMVTLDVMVASVTADGAPVHGNNGGTATAPQYNDWYMAAETGPSMYAKFGAAEQTLYVLPVNAAKSQLGCNTADFADPAIAGKVVLINRGTCTFTTKVMNAEAAGAAAVLIMNNKPDPALSQMPTVGHTIPAAMIMKSFGDGIRTAAGATTPPVLKVTFGNDLQGKKFVDPAVDTMSDFSSWGTSPDLKLRPDLTAPGGNIYSTLNNGAYASWDGTSMAAPQVAGASAVLLQAKPSLNPAMVKTAFQNTAKILIDPSTSGLPYSPRKQGAGRIQLNNAINTQVYVSSEDNTGAASLGEVTGTKSFMLTLTNTGNTAVSYDLNTSTIMAPKSVDFLGHARNSLSDELLSGATLTFRSSTATTGAGLTSVTVPKKSGITNGSIKIYGTLNVSGVATKNRFVEGFVKFTPKVANVGTALNVPFMGYMGNWKTDLTNLPIVDPSPADDTSYTGMTGAWMLNGTHAHQLGWECIAGTPCDPMNDADWHYVPAHIAVNPNTLGSCDSCNKLAAGATFLRNAKQAIIEIQDKNGKTVSRIANESSVRNIAIARPPFLWDQLWAWDGHTYNRTSGSPNEVPADGQYQIAYKTLAGNGDPLKAADWQVYRTPVLLDSAGPEVNITSTPSLDPSAPYHITWDATDPVSGVVGSFLFVDGNTPVMDGLVPKLFAPGSQAYDVTLTEGTHNIFAVTFDNAGNGAFSNMQTYDTTAIRAAQSAVAHNSEAKVKFHTNALVTNVVALWDGVVDSSYTFTPTTDGLHTYTKPGLTTEGIHTVSFDVYYAGDTAPRTSSSAINVYVDTTVPTSVITSPVTENRPTVNTTQVQLRGLATDNQYLWDVTVNGDSADFCFDLCSDTTVEWAADVSFDHQGKNVVQVVTSDAAGNSTTLARTFYVDSEAPILTSNVDDALGILNSGRKLVGDSMLDNGVFHLKGTAVSLGTGYTVKMNGEPLFSAPYREDSMGHVVPRDWTYDVPLSKEAPHQTVRMEILSDGGMHIEKTINLEYATFMSLKTDAPNGQWSPKVKNKLNIQVDLQAAAMLTVEVRQPWDMSSATGLFNPFPGGFGSNGVGTIFHGQGKKGANTFPWDGTLGGKKLPDGTYTLVARADDTSDEVTAKLVIKTDGPSLELYGEPSRKQNTKAVEINGVSSAPEVTVSGGNLSKAVVLKTDRLGRFFFKNDLTTDGKFTFTVTAKDALGNTTQDSVKVDFKKTSPAVPTVTQPAANLFIKDSTVAFSGSVAQADVAEIAVTVLLGSNTVAEKTVTVSNLKFSGSVDLGVDDGAYQLVFTATDSYGNISAGKIISTTLDTTAPVVNFQASPVSTATIEMDGTTGSATGTQNKAFKVGFKVTEDNLNTVKAKINNVNATVTGPVSGVYTVNTNSLKPGANKFEITVTDKAGFTVTYTVTVTGVPATTTPTTPSAPSAPTSGPAPTGPRTPITLPQHLR